MSKFAILASQGAHSWEMHIEGCADVTKKESQQLQTPHDTVEHETWQGARSLWVDPELQDMGYTESSVRVMPCAKSGKPVERKPLPEGTCPGSGGPFDEWERFERDGKRMKRRVHPGRVMKPCPVCRNLYGAGRGSVPRHKTPTD